MDELGINEVCERWPSVAAVLALWAKQAGLDLQTHVRFLIDANGTSLAPVLTDDGFLAVTDGICSVKRSWPSKDTLTVMVTWLQAGMDLRSSFMAKLPKDGSRGPRELELATATLVAQLASVMRGRPLSLVPISLEASSVPQPTPRKSTRRRSSRGSRLRAALAGTVTDPLETISMLQHGGRTGRMVLLSEDASVAELNIWMTRGDIIAAAAGADLRDRQALELLLTTPYMSFEFQDETPAERSIAVGTSAILLDLARRRDELQLAARTAAAMKDSCNPRSGSRRGSRFDSGITAHTQSRPRPFQRDLDRLCTELRLYPSAHQKVSAKLNHIRAINQRRELVVRTIMEISGADGFALDGKITQRKVTNALRSVRESVGPFTGDAWDDQAVIAFLTSANLNCVA